MNGELERLVYNKVMDLETMQLYQRVTQAVIEFITFYIFLPLSILLVMLLIYGIYKKNTKNNERNWYRKNLFW